MRETRRIGQIGGSGQLQFPSGDAVAISYRIDVSREFIDGAPGVADLKGSLVFEREPPLVELLKAFKEQHAIVIVDDANARRLEILVSGDLNLPSPRRCSFRLEKPDKVLATFEST